MEIIDNRKVKVLHIVKDDKFFDVVLKAFESDVRFENRSVLVVKSPQYEFSYIKQATKVELLWNKKMLKECLLSSDYDVIFFHTLTTDRYKYFQYIPKEKIVIWWTWGYDIYSESNGMKPLIQLEQLKPLTQKLFEERRKNILLIVKDVFYYFKGLLEKNYYYRLRNSVLSRIDFFQPVISLEYQIMKSIDGFRAKEFYYPKPYKSYQGNTGNSKSADGAILIGNSATLPNNHLDVWESIRRYIPNGRDIIIPANYGIMRYAKRLVTAIQSPSHNIRILKDFMPRDEYFQLLNGCTYAVFGVIRQQAMGNIYYCLTHGIKLFLYRDSIVYQFLKNNGYVVFTIEDIDENSFIRPLTQDQMNQNVIANEKRRKYEDEVREQAIELILKRCNKVAPK